jgi:putative membrane protein
VVSLGSVNTLLHLGALALTILVLSRLLPDVRIRSATTAVVVAVVFSILNFFLGWLIKLVLVVPTILTLGVLWFFVPFIVNAVVLWLTDKLLRSFEIRTTRGLLLSAAVLTVVSSLFDASFHFRWMRHAFSGNPTWV